MGSQTNYLGENYTKELETPTNITIKKILGLLMGIIDGDGERKREVISLGIGDPTAHSCFHTTNEAKEAVVESLLIDKFNGYSPSAGLPTTRKAIASYLSRDLCYELSQEDVYITVGCTQAIEIALSFLAKPNSNILLPRPGFPTYALCASFRNIEIRYYDLLPQNNWQLNLEAIEDLVDQNTIAIVIINPGNPCGNVYSYDHLKKIAETAKKVKTLIIADEVYGHLAFGETPFTSMGLFSSITPILTLGSLSKRWLIPGWRLGWFVINDPNCIFKSPKIIEHINNYCDLCASPTTFIQAAVPKIIENTKEDFFKNTLQMLKKNSDICYEKTLEIPCLNCPYKPQGSMVVMVNLNIILLQNIIDDMDFCFKLAKEEYVILLPGTAVGLKNWIRITFAVESSFLEEGLKRLKSFCLRHSKPQNLIN
ncbi:probable aminotransferase TAT2 isoform X1 [Solanum pennellii]|uniref:Probable aminotransferase TAT2 isoform X1 n=1 Tax=Solanum pennellii TaxID=28526 RepID=A0ABM1FP61_SOLPN|nr:probable aminotransferase TAT2 isoform X1 [Solanum pennellii]